MRPVRFEPTTLGLGNRNIEPIIILIKKLISKMPAPTGDQKQDQTFLDGKLLQINFGWRELPMEAKALIVAIFEATLHQNGTNQQSKAA